MTQTGGEKELILGNKQLISLFFVVVALCGVFFAMGYMVRGNGLKGSVASTDESAAPPGTDSIKRQQPEPPRETTDSASAGSAQPTTDVPPSETHAADDDGATVHPPPVGASVDAKAPMRAEARSELKLEELETGAKYVQVVALHRPDAEGTARMLREQHLPAAIAASSKEGLFRVLVGPYHETADIADAKARLKTLGFSEVQVVQKQ